MLAVAASPHDFAATLTGEGYFCPESFAPRQRSRGNGFPDDARLGRVPAAENQVVFRRIAVRSNDTTITTATCAASCRTRTVGFTRAAAFALRLSLQVPSHNQIVPRYRAAKRRRVQAGLGSDITPLTHILDHTLELRRSPPNPDHQSRAQDYPQIDLQAEKQEL